MSAAALVKRFEGVKDGNLRRPGLQPYRDPVGLWTIGYGHLLSPDPKAAEPAVSLADLAAAEALLTADLGKVALAVIAMFARPLQDHELDALTSFAYNVGTRSLFASTLRLRLERGDVAGAAEQFNRWVYSRGLRLPGLVIRRAAEKALFLGR